VNDWAGVKALTFDVYGTVVDWRRAIVREGGALRPSLDWEQLADAWRGLYRPTLDRVTRGELPWSPFDDLQRLMLDQVLERFGVLDVSEAERFELAGVWARLDPWPDAVPGLTRLKRRFVVCALSNGSVWQLVSLAKRAGLPWDLILSVEMFHAYKPDPRVYQGAVELLQCRPLEAMMVAAHVYDLRAARDVGMRTAFVARPLEWGPDATAEQPEPGEFDILARDFSDLADQLVGGSG
jgi:2-haloacid dehalogenase